MNCICTKPLKWWWTLSAEGREEPIRWTDCPQFQMLITDSLSCSCLQGFWEAPSWQAEYFCCWQCAAVTHQTQASGMRQKAPRKNLKVELSSFYPRNGEAPPTYGHLGSQFKVSGDSLQEGRKSFSTFGNNQVQGHPHPTPFNPCGYGGYFRAGLF